MIDNSILIEAIERGIIDITTISDSLDNMKRKEALEKHAETQNVWQGKDGAWYTYLPDARYSKGRRLIRKVKKDSLEDAIVEFYKENEDAPTFKEVFDRWINEKLELKEIVKGTYDRYKRDYARHIKDSKLEHQRISAITENDLEKFIKKRIADKHLTNKAYSNMRTLILGTFKYAKSYGYSNINITTFFDDINIGKKAFKSQHKTDEEQIFLEEEAESIIEWCWKQNKPSYLGLVLAFQTGMREGELAALKFSDVKGNKLYVNCQEVYYLDENDKPVYEIVDYTKTEAGLRKIYLTDKALNTIQRIRQLNPNNDFMFVENGKHIHSRAFNDRLYRACDKVGILRRSMHKIRKTYGTTLIDAKVDDSLVMQMMGHSDIETTRKYYYFSNKNDEKKAEQIKSAIGF